MLFFAFLLNKIIKNKTMLISIIIQILNIEFINLPTIILNPRKENKYKFDKLILIINTLNFTTNKIFNTKLII